MTRITSKIEVEICKIKKYVSFHIHEQKPYGFNDVDRRMKIFFDGLKKLPLLPKERPENYKETDIFWIRGRWLGFNLSSWLERECGPVEHEFSQYPHKVPNQPKPSREELKKAKKTKKVITRTIKLY